MPKNKTDNPGLTGLEKASLLIMSLDAEQSTAVLDQLTEEERVVIGAQMHRLRRVDDATRGRVLAESGQAMGELAATPPRPARRGLRGLFRPPSVSSDDDLVRRPPSPRGGNNGSPEQLLKLPPDVVRTVLSECVPLDLALVVMVGTDKLKSCILENLSTAELAIVRNHLASVNGATVGDIESAQRRITAAIRSTLTNSQPGGPR